MSVQRSYRNARLRQTCSGAVCTLCDLIRTVRACPRAGVLSPGRARGRDRTPRSGCRPPRPLVQQLGTDGAHEGERTAEIGVGTRGDRNTAQVDRAGELRRVAGLRVLVPEVGDGVGKLAGERRVVRAQRVVGGRPVAVDHDDGGTVLLLRQVLQHRQDRSAADPGRGEEQRYVGAVENQVAVRRGDTQPVARVQSRVQLRGDLALRTDAGPYPLDREGSLVDAGCPGEAVLAYLPGAVGEFHLDGDVLARPEGGGGRAVGGGDPEGGHVRGVLDAGGHRPFAPHVPRRHALLRVEPSLDRDQGVGHQPVDLVPGRGHLGSDGVAEYLCDRGEEVCVHDLVLRGGDAQ